MNHLDFEHKVSVEHLSYSERIQAATWAFDHFGTYHVNIFATGLKDAFLFERSEDAVFFALKWIV